MPGTEAPRPERGVFEWRSRTREGNVRLVHSSRPQQELRLAAVAKRRCLDDDNAKAAADARTILADSDLSGRIAADLRKGKLSYAELNRACVQEFEASLGAKRRQAIRTIFWRFARYDVLDKDDATRDLWSVFAREDGAFKPRYLTHVFDPHDVPSDLFEVLAVGDMNGDGIDEWIVRWLAFEAEEDNLVIVSWEKGTLVIVHDSDNAFP